MGFDLETTGLFPWKGALIDVIALRNELGITYILEAEKYPINDLKGLFERLQASFLVGHNIKFDVNFILYHYGVLLRRIHCTQMSAQLLENGRQKQLKFGLIDIIPRYLGNNKVHTFNKEEKKKLQESFTNDTLRKSLSRIPSVRARQLQYAAEDVEHLLPLYSIQLSQIENKDLRIVYELEHKTLPVLSKMEVAGALLDRKGWLKLVETVWEPELKALELKLDKEADDLLSNRSSIFSFKRTEQYSSQYDIFGSVTTSTLPSINCVNYGSSAQVLELWREFGEEPPRDSEGNYTVGEGAIETYVTENPKTRLARFIELLLEYREVYKLISTYGKSFLDQLDENDHIHTQYTQTRTETGRLSSKEPNLQNIPSAKEETRNIRKFFIAPPGYKFITCDMAAAEVRIAADYSQEPILLDSILNGADMHSELASISFSIIFKQPVTVKKGKDQITIDGYTYNLEELRDHHKSVVFAKFYKAGAKRVYGVLASYINRHHPPADRLKIAKIISDALDRKTPALSRYLSGLINQAQARGCLVADRLGRIRYFEPDVYGEAANYPRKLNIVAY